MKDAAVLMKLLDDARRNQPEGEKPLSMDELMTRAGEAMLMATVTKKKTTTTTPAMQKQRGRGGGDYDEHTSARTFLCRIRDRERDERGASRTHDAAIAVLREQCEAAGMCFRELKATVHCDDIGSACLVGQGQPMLVSASALGDGGGTASAAVVA